ncbi:cytochrome P450 [Rhodococcus sp. GXMU-t2271]|uniref:cytochrome P450 n=1 Tax=Rhodococcus sp. GXMU-t2271 TaxID=3059079 RepID=UPI00352AC0E8
MVRHRREEATIDTAHAEWDPRSEAVQADQVVGYDAMRARGPIAYDGDRSWTVFGHAEAVRILDDPATFSNAVSRHLQIPNGLDGERHRAYRAVVDRYFTVERLAAFEPACRAVAAELVAALPRGRAVEVMSALAEPFADNITCAFMGWPDALRAPLRAWAEKNRRATRAGDRAALSAVAVEFDGHIRAQLDARRGEPVTDPTGELLHETADGRPLRDEEIVSIVRNWTVGELSTIAASVGVVAGFLANHPEVQDRLRTDPSLLVAASDEILRIDPPFVASRRRVTAEHRVAGCLLPVDARVQVLWASVNRDEAVFGDPDEFRLDRDPADNLVYGRGVHYCPGAPLARLELRVLFEELLGGTARITPADGRAAVPARYPNGGFAELPLQFD